MKKNLFILYWSSQNFERNKEILDTVEKNIRSKLFDSITIFTDEESQKDLNFKNAKTIVGPRKTYQDIFDYSNDNFDSDENINILANSDIEFDSTINLTDEMLKEDFLALTRYNRETNELEKSHYDPFSDSQDVWIWKGYNKLKKCEFYLGTLGCDNKIAFRSFVSEYSVRNPSKSIKTYHNHESKARPGSSSDSNMRVSMPYVYLRPTQWKDKYQLILEINFNTKYKLIKEEEIDKEENRYFYLLYK